MEAPENIKLSPEEIANLSDAQFKTLVIRMPIEINDLKQKEEISSQPEQNEETRIQKYEERLRNLQDTFQHSNIQIIGVPEGEKEEQEKENSFKKKNNGELP